MADRITVEKSPHSLCCRCRRAHESVGYQPLYPDLCCKCAYDIHHGYSTNAHLFQKQGELKAPPSG